jgi:hypothetical protein
MRLITADRYSGLDPEVAKALKNGKTVKGIGWDGGNIYEVELVDYVSGRNYPFTCKTKTGDSFVFVKFTPDYEEEIDWSKVEVDTKIIVENWKGDIEIYRFHHYEKDNNAVWFYPNGWSSVTYPFKSGGSSGTEIACVSANQCRLANEVSHA